MICPRSAPEKRKLQRNLNTSPITPLEFDPWAEKPGNSLVPLGLYIILFILKIEGIIGDFVTFQRMASQGLSL